MYRRAAAARSFAAACLLALSAGGCVTGEALKSKAHVVGDLVAKARAQRAELCAPKAFAFAEAHLEFAEGELRTGDYLRAHEHLLIADKNARIAVRDSVGCVEGKVAFIAPKEGDRDGDGFMDHKDACPDDPEDFDGFEDEDGCPEKDNDKDGILDPADKCPLDPEDKDGFEDEDGCPELDNDKDGLVDSVDSCPMEPEDKDGFEDEDGCPDPDNDKDRIVDVLDKCPMDPEDYDGDADDDGCPDLYKLVVVTKDRIEIKEKIFFAFNKWAILKKSFPVLDDVAHVMKDNPTMRIEIQGHTDSRGGDAFNKTLSDKRARSVLDYLAKKGIAKDRMTSHGYGEEVPIDTNLTEDGRANNRRVEFHIVDR